MGMGLGDIFKAIVEELGDDAIGSAAKMFFDDEEDEFPIPMKKPFWEENNQQPEVRPGREEQKGKKKIKKAIDSKNIQEESNKTEVKSEVKSLEDQLAKLQQNESPYEYLASLEKEELKRGIIMSEILGKPRCKNRIRKRF